MNALVTYSATQDMELIVEVKRYGTSYTGKRVTALAGTSQIAHVQLTIPTNAPV